MNTKTEYREIREYLRPDKQGNVILAYTPIEDSVFIEIPKELINKTTGNVNLSQLNAYAKWSDIMFEYTFEVKNMSWNSDKFGGLNPAEHGVMQCLVDAWGKYCRLEKQHPTDLQEFHYAIHTLQSLLGMRALRRLYPDYWMVHKERAEQASKICRGCDKEE